MRIGLVSGEFPPMQGGVGAFSERLAQAVSQLGHELHVMTHHEARPPMAARGLARLAQIGRPVETTWGQLHPVGRRWGWRDVGKIADIALRYDLDVINIQYQAAAYNMRSPAINLAPWRLDGIAPVVVTFHDLRVPYLFPKAGRIRQYAVRFAAQRARGVIVTNSEDRRVVEGWGLDQTRLRQIPIGSNIRTSGEERVAIDAARRAQGVRRDAFLLGYFGFLNPSKGADYLVQAMAKLDRDIHAVFIGGRTGSSDSENNQRFVASVEAQARELDVEQRLHWTGYMPDRDISRLLQAVDLIVLPYRDGVSLRRGTLMAALAHGCAIVSSKPEARIEDLKHGENIWLVPPSDEVALVEAIQQLRNDDVLRERLAEGARRLARQFSWDSIAAQTVDFFESLPSDK
jgi:glycosyltransferase involved in cell wall biosynthesis